jgi:hypothetical protein
VTATDWILGAQALASGAMCGLIWFVQVVHYPLFGRVVGDAAVPYAHDHQRLTPLVVIPPMLVEGITSLVIAARPPEGIGRAAAWSGLVLVLALWASTGAIQMPLHRRLGQEGHAPAAVRRLVRGNWFRTLLWTARAVLALWMLRVAA